jgi:hypothetical protein
VLAGAVVGLIPNLNFIAVDAHWRILYDALLFFMIGALAGATLGGAFAPQRSSHAAFRIIDEIERGGFVVVVTLDPETATSARDLLTAHGGLHVLHVPSGE